MKIIKLKDTLKVNCPNGGFISNRYLLEKDGMGYTITNTFIPKGEPQRWHYKYHLESCLCIKGHGKIQDVKTLKVYDIKPGTMYVLNNHDEHAILRMLIRLLG